MLETLIRNVTLDKEWKKGACQSPEIPCIYARVGRGIPKFEIELEPELERCSEPKGGLPKQGGASPTERRR